MNGGGNKWKSIPQIMRSHGLSILVLQETHLSDARASEFIRVHGHKYDLKFSSTPRKETSVGGVAFILNKEKLTLWASFSHHIIIKGSATSIKIRLRDESTFTIINVYAPSGNPQENRTFWSNVETLTTSPTKVAALLGDMNMIEDPVDRLNRGAEALPPESFVSLKAHLRLYDAWRT
jgi:exonuclease III